MNATTMKQSFPILFGETAVPFPLTWEEQHTDVITTNMTEDGKDHVLYTRRDKLKISASWKCTDEWVAFFRRYASSNSFTIQIYNTMTKAYEQRTVRVHDFTCSLVKKSWNLYVSYGLWEVSFTIEEF